MTRVDHSDLSPQSSNGVRSVFAPLRRGHLCFPWAAAMLAASYVLTAGQAFASSTVEPAQHAVTTDAVDWDRVGEEAAALLARYVQIDTTNPPGNELAAAEFLADLLRREGLEAEVAQSEPGRGNVYARRRGTGGGKAIVLLNHLDVVPTNPAKWTVPPFEGVRRDGFVYGRGTLDCKGVAIAQLMAVLLLQRRGVALVHDVVFLGTADEENGGALGAAWVVQKRSAWLRGASALLNEGDYIHIEDGRPIAHVAVAEKAPCWLRLVARGPGGHGSTPPADTAVTRLVRALERIRTHETPLHVVPAVAQYFATISALTNEPPRSYPLDLDAALQDPFYLAAFESDPHRYALVHNTITPTVLAGSAKTNVIPAEARADLDCRLLPGEDPEAFIQTIRALIDDPNVEVQQLLSFPASSSPADGWFVQAIRQVAARELDGAAVVPSVLAGFTDSHYFRDLGIPSYGFVPFKQNVEERLRMHGRDERIGVGVLRDAIRFLYALLSHIE